jgi:Tol biopolymer transport system component
MGTLKKLYVLLPVIPVLILLFIQSGCVGRLNTAPSVFFTARHHGYYGLFVHEGWRTRELFFSGELLKSRPNMARYHITFDVSPDGRFVAFSAMSIAGNMDIFLLDREGGGTKNITRDMNIDTQPVFSRDGTHIAYLAHEPGGRRYDNIFLISLDGSGRRRLTTHFFRVFSLEFSPDDQQVLYTWATSDRSIVSLVDVKNGAIRDLTPYTCSSRNPTFNRDGTMIVYTSNYRGTYDIWTVTLEGLSRTLLYNDGRSIVFLSDAGENGSDWSNSILSIGLEGGDPVNLLEKRDEPPGAIHSHLGVSKGDNRISFQTRYRSKRGVSRTGVYTMEIDAQHMHEIYERPGTLSSLVLFARYSHQSHRRKPETERAVLSAYLNGNASITQAHGCRSRPDMQQKPRCS